MKRRLINLLTALSLVLCVAVVALWVQSYVVVDELQYRHGSYNYAIGLAGGQFDLFVTDESPFEMIPQGWRWRQWRGVDERLLWRRSVSSSQNPFSRRPVRPARFGCWWGTQSVPVPEFPAPVVTRYIYVPIWPLALACAALPGSWFVRNSVGSLRLRGRRVSASLCASCGYDLRATQDGCPECDNISAR